MSKNQFDESWHLVSPYLRAKNETDRCMCLTAFGQATRGLEEDGQNNRMKENKDSELPLPERIGSAYRWWSNTYKYRIDVQAISYSPRRSRGFAAPGDEAPIGTSPL